MALFGEDPRRIERLEDQLEIIIQATGFVNLLNEVKLNVRNLEFSINEGAKTFNASLGDVRSDVTKLETRVGQLPTKASLMWAVGLILPLLALFSLLYYDEISSKTDVFVAKIEPVAKRLDTVSATVDQLQSTVAGLAHSVLSAAPRRKRP
jgi:methyl-accepting chemotaxis protein